MAGTGAALGVEKISAKFAVSHVKKCILLCRHQSKFNSRDMTSQRSKTVEQTSKTMSQGLVDEAGYFGD